MLRFRRLLILCALFAAIATTALIGAHATSSTKPPPKPPISVSLVLDPQGAVVFNPSAITCYAQIPCVDIANTTGLTIDLYQNGNFSMSMPPGDVVGSGFSFPGTDTFTIPNTNPNAQLVVTVVQLTVSNVNLIVNAHGKLVFSSKRLTCLYFIEYPCFTLTNQTSQTIQVYQDGGLCFTITPGQVAQVTLNQAGKNTFTIPANNPKAKLVVTGK